MVYVNAGQQLKVLRVKEGLTQLKLAENVGVSSNFISAIERGKKKGSILFYIDIANYFNVPLDYLFYEDLKCKESIMIKRVELIMSYMNEADQKYVLDIIEGFAKYREGIDNK